MVKTFFCYCLFKKGVGETRAEYLVWFLDPLSLERLVWF